MVIKFSNGATFSFYLACAPFQYILFKIFFDTFYLSSLHHLVKNVFHEVDTLFFNPFYRL